MTYLVIEKTDFGLVVQAGTQDSEMVRMLGIKINRSYSLVFALGAALAAFAGLIGAVRAPLRRKLRGLAVAVPIIYGLNLLRTTFIGITFGEQLLHIYPDVVLMLFGASDKYLVSWFISDRILSQLLAVIALVGVTYLVVRELPEILTIIEDVLYMVTNDEYDLEETLDLPRSTKNSAK